MSHIACFKIENQTNPIVIETKNPCFSWRFESSFTNVQSKYRIVVASKKELIASDTPDLWDSRFVCSKDCFVKYNGKALESKSLYFVKLWITDNAGETFSSDICSFETGLNQFDWKGSWVAIPVNFNGGTLLFRKKIHIEDKKIVRARAYVCGLGYHEFFVNGVKMSDSVLNPAVSSYEKRVFYCAYSIETLNVGDNVIGVEVGYGWFGDRKLLVQVYVEYEDGTVLEEHSGPANGWWVGGSPTVDNGIYGGEVYDARIEDKYPLNWNTVDFEPTWANGWMYTIYTPAPQGKLEAQQIQPIRVCSEYREKTRKDMGNGILVIDVGANIAGWAKIKVKGERGSSITLKFGERLTKDGYVNQLNLRSARCSDTYILKGDGVEVWAPRFTYHGFQYVQAEITGKAKLISCVAQHVHTDAPIVGQFDCSDKLLKNLHEIAVRTEQNNEHSILTDCPQRDERFGWLNDLGSRIFQTVYNVDVSRLLPKFARDITHSQNAEGAIADTVPFYTGGIPADPVCVIYPLTADLSYRFYGDKSVAVDEYDSIKKWVNLLLSHSKDYIMDYYYYADWVPPFPEIKADNIFVSSFYLLWHLKLMVKLAKIVGNKKDVKIYSNHVRKSVSALNFKYFNESTCNYAFGHQTENGLALSLGVVPENFIAKVAENLNNDVIKHNYHCTSGNVGYRHVFYALADNGYLDTVLKILKNPEYPGWGYMISNGATSVWERWEAEMQNEMHSFNHPMFGSYDAIFYRYLAGIEIDADAVGCDKFSIKPVFTNQVKYVQAKFSTVRGDICVKWKRSDDNITVNITVPPTATAVVDFGNGEFTVGSGSYEFII